jgi:hypothetical protein
MKAMRWILVTGAVLMAVPATWSGAAESKLGSIDRSIGKLPQLNDPVYALAVFGAGQETRVWMVADKSSPQATARDVLYIDLNADGDLTSANERIAGQVDSETSRFSCGDWTDPAPGLRHSDLSLRLTDGKLPFPHAEHPLAR